MCVCCVGVCSRAFVLEPMHARKVRARMLWRPTSRGGRFLLKLTFGRYRFGAGVVDHFRGAGSSIFVLPAFLQVLH